MLCAAYIVPYSPLLLPMIHDEVQDKLQKTLSGYHQVAKEISVMSGVSEGNSYSTLKDFRTYLKKALLAGRIVNIAGLSKF